MGRRFMLVLALVLGACGFTEMKKPPLAGTPQRRLYADAWAAASRWGVTNPLGSDGARRACAWLMRDRAMFDEVLGQTARFVEAHGYIGAPGRSLETGAFMALCSTLRDKELEGVAPRRHGRAGFTLAADGGYAIANYYFHRGGLDFKTYTGHGPTGSLEAWVTPFNMVAFGVRATGAQLAFDGASGTYLGGEFQIRGWINGGVRPGGVYLTGGLGMAALLGGDDVVDGFGDPGFSFSGSLGSELFQVGRASVVSLDVTLAATMLGENDAEQFLFTLRWDVR